MAVKPIAWSDMTHLMRDYKDGSLNRQYIPPQTGASYIAIENNTGRDLLRYDVVGIDEPLNQSNIYETGKSIVFSGVVPSNFTHANKFAVIQECANKKDIVMACVYGVTPVFIRWPSSSSSPTYVGAVNGETGFLGGSGQAQVLWCSDRDGYNDRKAYVRIGGGGGVGGGHLIGVTTTACTGSTEYIDVEVRNGNNVMTFDKMLCPLLRGDQEIPSGTPVELSWRDDRQCWYISNAACPEG